MRAVIHTKFSGPVKVRLLSRHWCPIFGRWEIYARVTGKNPHYDRGECYFFPWRDGLADIYSTARPSGYGYKYYGRLSADDILALPVGERPPSATD